MKDKDGAKPDPKDVKQHPAAHGPENGANENKNKKLPPNNGRKKSKRARRKAKKLQKKQARNTARQQDRKQKLAEFTAFCQSAVSYLEQCEGCELGEECTHVKQARIAQLSILGPVTKFLGQKTSLGDCIESLLQHRNVAVRSLNEKISDGLSLEKQPTIPHYECLRSIMYKNQEEVSKKHTQEQENPLSTAKIHALFNVIVAMAAELESYFDLDRDTRTLLNDSAQIAALRSGDDKVPQHIDECTYYGLFNKWLQPKVEQYGDSSSWDEEKRKDILLSFFKEKEKEKVVKLHDTFCKDFNKKRTVDANISDNGFLLYALFHYLNMRPEWFKENFKQEFEAYRDDYSLFKPLEKKFKGMSKKARDRRFYGLMTSYLKKISTATPENVQEIHRSSSYETFLISIFTNLFKDYEKELSENEKVIEYREMLMKATQKQTAAQAGIFTAGSSQQGTSSNPFEVAKSLAQSSDTKTGPRAPAPTNLERLPPVRSATPSEPIANVPSKARKPKTKTRRERPQPRGEHTNPTPTPADPKQTYREFIFEHFRVPKGLNPDYFFADLTLPPESEEETHSSTVEQLFGDTSTSVTYQAFKTLWESKRIGGSIEHLGGTHGCLVNQKRQRAGIYFPHRGGTHTFAKSFIPYLQATLLREGIFPTSWREDWAKFRTQ